MEKKEKTPQERYDERTARRISLKLNKITDADVLEKLESVESMQGYIKSLIRADIAAGEDVNELSGAAEVIERLARENERQKFELEQLRQRVVELEQSTH